MKPLRLLLPEWQGFGLHADVSRGAEALSARLFDGGPDLIVDAPKNESLHVDDGVLGLSSIADRLRLVTAELQRRAPDRITMIGGTCAVELAPVSYLNHRYAGDVAVLWIDAHADLNTQSSSPSAHAHGMALRLLMGEGHLSLTKQVVRPLKPSQAALVGARDLDPAERDFVAARGIPVFGDAVFRDPAPVIAWLSRHRHVYIHCDVDVLDPAGFKGALMHAPGGGPAISDLVSFIATVQARTDVVGLSIVEFCDRDAETTRVFVDAVARGGLL